MILCKSENTLLEYDMQNMNIQNIETESVNIFTKRLFIFFAKMRIQKSIQKFLFEWDRKYQVHVIRHYNSFDS